MPGTATTIVPEDASTVLAGIRYKTVITHVTAKRDAHNNLIMKIRLDHPKREAIFNCIDRESVGNHSMREVQFTASDNCILHFDKSNVFGITELTLSTNVAVAQPVVGKTGDETSYWVEYIPKTKAAKAMQSAAPATGTVKQFAPPVIVVP